jgi:hypothetical protein
MNEAVCHAAPRLVKLAARRGSGVAGLFDDQLRLREEDTGSMTNLQLYLAIGLPIIAVLTSLVVSLVQISAVREEMRGIRDGMRSMWTELREEIRGIRQEFQDEIRALRGD